MHEEALKALDWLSLAAPPSNEAMKNVRLVRAALTAPEVNLENARINLTSLRYQVLNEVEDDDLRTVLSSKIVEIRKLLEKEMP